MASKADLNLLDESVRRRLSDAARQIGRSIHEVARGNPYGAEPSPARLVDRISLKTGLDPSQARDLAGWITTEPTPGELAEAIPGPEALIGPTLDFLGVAFLEKGRAVADAVVRIRFRDGRPQGTGALVAPGIIITNNHVISSAGLAQDFLVEFDFEKDVAGQNRAVTTFELDPVRLYAFDTVERLDYTVIALGKKVAGARDLSTTAYLPLSDAPNKHVLGEVANVIQHPRGDFKQVALRENRLVSRLEFVLHYVADTEPGSSGSPVFNNEWQMIALHHWGGPSPFGLSTMAPSAPSEINEGIRISAIVKDLREKLAAGHAHSIGIRALLSLWDGASAPVANTTISNSPAVDKPQAGDITQEKTRIAMPNRSDEDFSDRAGYEPGFLSDFVVPLPRLKNNAKGRPARNLDARIGEDPHELKYHHFSIVMNAKRRLAYFTACNIDGKLTRHVNRADKTVNMHPTITDLQIESAGAEASDDFSIDWRVNPDEQMGIEFYQKQKVPGFPVAQSRDRIARMFQKGHIIMRGDPAWGTKTMALAAEADSFFYTNAAPQLGFFNQGSRDNHPGEKGKIRWRAVETYVLRNAVKERERVCVFAGPIFDDEDPVYRDHPVPMQFWKIVVWSDGGQPKSIALLASQREVLDELTQGIPENFANTPEAFDELPELARVKEFRTTVAKIERLTHLDFSDVVRNADIGAGAPEGAIMASDVSGGRVVRSARNAAKKAARKRPRK
jgi:endonuclease G